MGALNNLESNHHIQHLELGICIELFGRIIFQSLHRGVLTSFVNSSFSKLDGHLVILDIFEPGVALKGQRRCIVTIICSSGNDGATGLTCHSAKIQSESTTSLLPLPYF